MIDNTFDVERRLKSAEKKISLVAKVAWARFPHRSLLHYAYTPLFQENNSDNNRRPLGLWRFVHMDLKKSRSNFCL